MFNFLAFAPAGVLLAQELDTPKQPEIQTPETLAALDFIRVGSRTRQLLKTGDQIQIRDARVEASTSFATLNLFLTPASKKHMVEILRSYESWWPQNINDLPSLYQRNGLDLGTPDEIKDLLAPDVQYRESAIALLDDMGIDDFLGCVPRLIHPDRQRFIPPPKNRMASSSFAACGGGWYEDGFFAAIGVLGSSLGIAAMMGCIPCGPVAMGIGFGASLLKAARTVSCAGGQEKK